MRGYRSLLLVLSLLILVRALHHYATSTNKHSYSLHGSPEVSLRVKQLSLQLFTTHDPRTIDCSLFLEQCPALQRVTSWTRNGHRSFFFTYHMPTFALNEHFVLLENGSLAERAWLPTSLCYNLKTIRIDQENIPFLKNNPDASIELLSLPGELFSNYQPYWINKKKLYLVHTAKQWFICAEKSSHITPSILQQCDAIFNHLAAEKIKHQPVLIADTRFKDYIIVTKRGSHEKGTIF